VRAATTAATYPWQHDDANIATFKHYHTLPILAFFPSRLLQRPRNPIHTKTSVIVLFFFRYADFLAGQGLLLDATSVLMDDLRQIVTEKYSVNADSYGQSAGQEIAAH